ncbi:hypothetical protein LguiA_008664 [Lonicera macranthoides]
MLVNYRTSSCKSCMRKPWTRVSAASRSHQVSMTDSSPGSNSATCLFRKSFSPRPWGDNRVESRSYVKWMTLNGREERMNGNECIAQ